MIAIAAMVSLYPLRQGSLSPVIEEASRVFREYGLEVQPGPGLPAPWLEVGAGSGRIAAALVVVVAGLVGLALM